MISPCRLVFTCISLLAAGALQAAPVDRELSLQIALEGHQNWRNALQWSKATTTQRYEIATLLRSDGKLHGANLLDPDLETRLAIKTEYLRQQGVQKLQQAGIDPKSSSLMSDLSRRAQKDTFDCKGESNCMSTVGIKYAELMAAAVEPDNSEVLQGEPRYLFFFGFPGCSNRIMAEHQYQATGETAYGRNKDKIFPYALSYDGKSKGSTQEQQSLCMNFTVVLDTLESKMFVENVLIPAARGKITRTEFEKTQTSEAELPLPAPLQEWVNSTLRHAALSGKAQTQLPLTMPLDGNSTVMGNFTGQAKTTLSWSFNTPEKL